MGRFTEVLRRVEGTLPEVLEAAVGVGAPGAGAAGGPPEHTVEYSRSARGGERSCELLLRLTSRCNQDCPFCSAPPPHAEPSLPAVMKFLDKALPRLPRPMVTLTGGEPTLQRDLSLFLSEVRALGFAIKLDTNGSRPEVLDALLERGLVDALAMDLKAPRPRYAEYSGVSVDLDAIERSICCIRESASEYEFRTTVAPGLGVPDLEAMAEWIRGARRYVLQPFRVPAEKGLVDPSWAERDSLSPATLREAWTKIAPLVRGGGVRA